MAVADPRRLRRVRICRLKWVDILGVLILAMWVVVPCSRALTPEGEYSSNTPHSHFWPQNWHEVYSLSVLKFLNFFFFLVVG